MLKNWKNISVVNTEYIEGYEREDGARVYFTKEGLVNFYEDEFQKISLEELITIYNYAKSLKEGNYGSKK